MDGNEDDDDPGEDEAPIDQTKPIFDQIEEADLTPRPETKDSEAGQD